MNGHSDTESFAIDRVKIASYVFIETYRIRNGRDASGVLFNKFITLLNRNIRNQYGIDMKLSHCWYRWGDVVVKYSIPYIRWNYSDDGTTTVSFKGQAPVFDDNDIVNGYIRDYADSFVDNYGKGMEGVESAIDEVYSEAPFEFQNRFRALRETLGSAANSSISNIYGIISTLFEESMSSFPSEFDGIRSFRDQFASVFGECVRRRIEIKALQEIAEDFWFFFCSHLRIQCNENVSDETLGIWKADIPMENERYSASIQNYAYRYCSDSDNPMIKDIISEREDRLDELENILEDLRV